VYGIVKQHQGWIEVTSRPEQGAMFKVFLPASLDTARIEPSPKQKLLPHTGTETILLVEDEPPLRELAKRLLEHRGYHVLTAGSGVQALEAWENAGDKIDLLLTDMVMPEGMSGQELAKTLLALKPSLRVIYTSGYSLDLMEKDSTVKAGIAFLQKPYHPHELAEFVRQVLDVRIKSNS